MDQTILVKPGVVFREFNQYTLEFLSALLTCAKRFGQTYTITDAFPTDNKTHNPKGYHPKSLAWDVRLKDKTIGHRYVLQSALQCALPGYFDVVLEGMDDGDNVHLHVECDLNKLANFLLMDHPEGGK